MSATVLSILLNGIWQAGLLALGGLFATRLLARARAELRYVVWLAVLVAAVLAPVVTQIEFRRAAAWEGERAPASVLQPKAIAAPSGPSGAVPVSTGDAAGEEETATQSSAATINTSHSIGRNLLRLYLAIALLLLVRILVDLRRMRSLKRRARPLPVRVEVVLARCRRVFGVRRRLSYGASADIGTPVFVGLFRPMLLLPESSVATVQERELVQVGAHELAHACRRDDWLALFERAVRALLFFNPAIRWICAQLSLTREMACDEWVCARADTSPDEYANTLLRVAERAVWNRRWLRYAAALDGSSLRRRVDWLLAADFRARAQPAPARMIAATAALALAVSAVVAAPGVAFTVADAALPAAAELMSTTNRHRPLVMQGDPRPRLDAALNALEAAGFSGAALVAIDGDVVLHRGFGVMDRRTGRKTTAATAFHSGAIAKVLTAAAILRLEEMGKLSVNDRITRWIGPLPAPRKDVTIHHLLVHAGGLTPLDQPVFTTSRDDFIRKLRETPADFAPGTRQRHTDIGYSLLALIIELASGVPYEQFVRTELLQRAGMNETWFQNESPRAVIATEYIETGNALSAVGTRPYLWGRRGAMGVYSTAEDLYRWQRALENGLFDPDQLERMHSANLDNPWGSVTGYGWETRTNAHGARIHHVLSGWDGNSVELMNDPITRTTIALIIDNRVIWNHPRYDALQNIAFGVADPAGMDLRHLLRRVAN